MSIHLPSLSKHAIGHKQSLGLNAFIIQHASVAFITLSGIFLVVFLVCFYLLFYKPATGSDTPVSETIHNEQKTVNLRAYTQIIKKHHSKEAASKNVIDGTTTIPNPFVETY